MGSPLSVPSGPSKVSDLRVLDYRRVHVTPCLVIHSWNILLNILWRLLTNAFTIWWIIGVLVAEVHNQVTANLVPSPSLGGRNLPCGRCFCIRPISVCLLLFFSMSLTFFWIPLRLVLRCPLRRCYADAEQGRARIRLVSVDHPLIMTLYLQKPRINLWVP
jgi:hypothetical protein